MHYEFVSWHPADGQHQTAHRAVPGVQLPETRRRVAEPVARPDAGRRSVLPAVPPSTEFPVSSTGVLGLLNVCQPVCSVTAPHPTRSKLHTHVNTAKYEFTLHNFQSSTINNNIKLVLRPLT